MQREEAEEFEKLPTFEVLLKMRLWDEQSKEPNVAVDSLEKYQLMCEKYLQNLNV